MDKDDVLLHFEETLLNDPNKSEAVAAIQTLIKCIEVTSAETLVGMRENLKETQALLTTSERGMVTSISSGCELFLRFITLTALDHPDFQECRRILIERGNLFLQDLASSRKKIADLACPFITDGQTILIHSRSRVVLEILQQAVQAKKRCTVYVTQSLPDKSGEQMCSDLQSLGIPTVLILDAAAGYIMEKVDMLLLGAEGVMESGGIINKIGTYNLALCAKALNKPVYVVAESFKFARIYPLNQQDVPNAFKYRASKLKSSQDLTHEHPMVDYTPPAYLTLLFTNLGVLTPSAVSDELIKLYL